MLDIFLTQVTDVFRIGLMAGLIYTTHQTVRVTGKVLPLVAGIIFVAVIIPSTQGNNDLTQMGVGVLSNAAILAVLGPAYLAFLRYRR